MMADFAYGEWPEAAKYVSISDTASRWTVAQPFGSEVLTENTYRIEVLYPQTVRWVFRQCFYVAVADGWDPCNGFIIRHFIGVICHGHQLVIE